MPAADGQEAALHSKPCVRWYDARARVALRCLAAWLRVPWTKVLLLAPLLWPHVPRSQCDGTMLAAEKGVCIIASMCLIVALSGISATMTHS